PPAGGTYQAARPTPDPGAFPTLRIGPPAWLLAVAFPSPASLGHSVWRSWPALAWPSDRQLRTTSSQPPPLATPLPPCERGRGNWPGMRPRHHAGCRSPDCIRREPWSRGGAPELQKPPDRDEKGTAPEVG